MFNTEVEVLAVDRFGAPTAHAVLRRRVVSVQWNPRRWRQRRRRGRSVGSNNTWLLTMPPWHAPPSARCTEHCRLRGVRPRHLLSVAARSVGVLLVQPRHLRHCDWRKWWQFLLIMYGWDLPVQRRR